MMKKAELFQSLRDQAQKVLPFMNQSNSVKNSDKNGTDTTAQIIEGEAKERSQWDTDYQDVQQLFRQQFPSITKQLLGKRYQTVNKISRFVLPSGMDQVADELLELIADFASHWASSESVLSATGCKNLSDLCKDQARSKRAGFALKEVNKAIAVVQGGLSGMTGLIGATFDLPASVVIALKTIYEVGHAYGFDLDQDEDQKAVYFALSKMDLGLIAEKQVIFLVLRSLKTMLDTGDFSTVQGFLNSNHSIEQFSQFLVDENGQYKWPSLMVLNRLKVLRFATPVVGGVVGAVYGAKLVEEVALKADDFFSQVRHYLDEHPDYKGHLLEAYEAQQVKIDQKKTLIAQASPVLLASVEEVDVVEQQEKVQEQAIEAIEEHHTIVNVHVEKKPEVVEVSEESVEQSVTEGFERLSAENLSTHADPQVSVGVEEQQVSTENKDVIEELSSESEVGKNVDQEAESHLAEKVVEQSQYSDAEDLTKDLVKLVKVYTEKTKKVVQEVEHKVVEKVAEIKADVVGVQEDNSIQSEQEDAAKKIVAKPNKVRKTTTPRRPRKKSNDVKKDAD